MKAAQLISAEFENLQQKTTLYPAFQSLIVRSQYGYEVNDEVKRLPEYCKQLVIVGAVIRDWFETLKPSESFRRNQSAKKRRFDMLHRASKSVYPDIASRAQESLRTFEVPRTQKVKRVVPQDIMNRVNPQEKSMSTDDLIELWQQLASRIGECYEDKIVKAYETSLKSLPFGKENKDDYDEKAERERIQEEEDRRMAEDMELAERLDREWNN